MLSLLFSLKGRISRSRFWLGLLIVIIVGIAAGLLLQFSAFNRNPLDPAAAPLEGPARQIYALLPLLFVYPNFAVIVKRFHDRGKSGQWALPFLVLDLLIIGADLVGIFATDRSTPARALMLASIMLALIWLVVELGVLKGTAGANRFGTDPLAPTNATP